MKKTTKGIAAVIAMAMIMAFAGCASSAPAQQATQAPTVYTAPAPAQPDRPDWVLNPPQDDTRIYGLGSAQSPDESLGWKMSENRARMSISYQITSIIKGMQVDYQQQAGTSGSEVGLNFFEDIGRQLTASVLSGARTARRGQSRSGTYYALASYSIADIKSAVASNVSSQAAQQARINANNALRAMDVAFAALEAPPLVETDE
jgi:hypothetical protein